MTERKESGYSWQQTQLIKSYKQMGASLARELAGLPDLRQQLTSLVHNPGFRHTYEDTLDCYFQGLEQSGDIASLTDNPFVRAFKATTQCTPEEAVFLEQLRNPEDFREWRKTRLPFMAKGLQRCVLDGSIERLTPEEMRTRFVDRQRRFIEENPERFATIQARAAQAAKEANAKPNIYTDEVRQQIQQWFDRGLDYVTVAGLLKGIGINTTTKGLIGVVWEYDDLHYTPAEMKKERQKGLLKAAQEILNLSGSRRETARILKDLGFSPDQTYAALNKLSLREQQK